MNRQSISIWFATIVFAPVVLLQLAGCTRGETATPAATAPAPAVSVATVVSRQISDFDEFTGRFEAVDRVEIRPRVDGYISSVNFVQGGEVHRGEVLFVIDPRPYEAALKRAQAQLEDARSQLTLATSEQERADKLLAAHAISREELESRDAALQQAHAAVAGSQAAVDTAALNLSFTRVTAPITGVVGRAEITAGNLVTSGQTLLTTVVSVDPIYVSFQSDEQGFLNFMNYARSSGSSGSGSGSGGGGSSSSGGSGGGSSSSGSGGGSSSSSSSGGSSSSSGSGGSSSSSGSGGSSSSSGSGGGSSSGSGGSSSSSSSSGSGGGSSSSGGAAHPVFVGLANEEGYPHRGTMVFVDNEIDAATGTVRARGRLANPNHEFTPGMFARVKVTGARTFPALLINQSAVGTDQGLTYVLRVGKDNTIEYRQVTLGRIVDGLRVVREGLTVGDTIVVNGLQHVRPGMTITPQRVAMGEEPLKAAPAAPGLVARTAG